MCFFAGERGQLRLDDAGLLCPVGGGVDCEVELERVLY